MISAFDFIITELEVYDTLMVSLTDMNDFNIVIVSNDKTCVIME